MQVQHQDLALKLDRQIGSFPVEYKAEGASPALIEAEVWVVIIINKRIIVECREEFTVGFHRGEL